MDLLDSVIAKILSGAVEYTRIKLMHTGIGDVELKNWEIKHEGESPEIFSFDLFLKLMKIVGLTDFKVDRLKLQLNDPGVDFDIYIPEVFFTLGDGGINLKYLFSNADAQISGRIIVAEPRITGKANFVLDKNDASFSPFSNMDLLFKMNSIKADFKVVINGKDYSEVINNIVNITVPNLIKKYQPSVNYFFEQVVLTVIKFARSSSATSGQGKSNLSVFTLAMLRTASGLKPEILDLLIALTKLK